MIKQPKVCFFFLFFSFVFFTNRCHDMHLEKGKQNIFHALSPLWAPQHISADGKKKKKQLFSIAQNMCEPDSLKTMGCHVTCALMCLHA